MNIILSEMTRRQFLKLAGASAAAAPLAAALRHRPVVGAAGLAPQGDNATKPNIVLVVVDALRSDHVSANGYARGVTPNLDRWVASEGVSFRQATTPSPWTFPASAALMTGQLPFRLNATWDHTILPSNALTLAEILKQEGYATAGFVSAPFVRAGPHGFGQGFDVYDDSIAYQNVLEGNDQAGSVNTAAHSWLASWSPGSQPLFLFLYYFDPHTWYNPPSPYDTRYDPGYTGAMTPAVYRNAEDVLAGKIVPSPRDIEHLIALYDGEIAYWDAMLDVLFDSLQARGLLDNALVIVTSDHGDMFGEHGKWTHGNCLYEDVLRVPLLMRYPGIIPKGATIDAPVQNMDVLPTIMDLLGLVAPANLDGVSIRALAEGRSAPPHDVFSEIEGSSAPGHWAYGLAPRGDLRAIRSGDYKYIHHVRDGAADELYLLQPSSPYETLNLINSEPAVAQGLRQLLFERYRLAAHEVALPCVVR